MVSSLGGADGQVKAHVQANKNVGNDKGTLIGVITQCLPYIGFPRTLNALGLVNEIFIEKQYTIKFIAMAKHEEVQNGIIFPIGEKNSAYAQYFIGQSYYNALVSNPEISITVGNVSFEPGCRNNWHCHNGGFQILMVTGGEGWYQEFGKPAQALKAGDVVVINDGVKHWHGATKDSWFEHIAITAGTPEWLEPVNDDHYNNV